MDWKAFLKTLKKGEHLQSLVAFLAGSLIFGIIGWFTPPPALVARYTGAVLFQTSNTSNYQFIDPLLTCEIGSEEVFTDTRPMQKSLEAVIEKMVDTGTIESASVYYRSLKTAHWFDINPTTTYAPASLLKVFVMMAYFKESRDLNDPNLLLRQVPFQGSENPARDDSPGADIPHLVSGQMYSIDDLIKQMIVYSDNDALATLTANFDPQTTTSLSEIFSDLRITSPLTDEKSYYMSVNQYSMVFRVLYNSTYLNRRLSEKALTLLSQAAFRNGIVSGVPEGVSVAHKFGITTIPAGTTTPARAELHDCGIVYYPGHPYVLCVMTAGSSFPVLTDILKKLSETAYAEQRKLYPG